MSFSHLIPAIRDTRRHMRDERVRGAASFNHLAGRIHSLFRLNARINEGTSLNDTLRFVREEFSRFLPVDWVGVLTPAATPGEWMIDRVDSRFAGPTHEGECHQLEVPVSAPRLLDLNAGDSFARRLHGLGCQIAVMLPLGQPTAEKVGAGKTAQLVFAATDATAYGPNTSTSSPTWQDKSAPRWIAPSSSKPSSSSSAAGWPSWPKAAIPRPATICCAWRATRPSPTISCSSPASSMRRSSPR